MSIGLDGGRGFVCEDITVVIADRIDLARAGFDGGNSGSKALDKQFTTDQSPDCGRRCAVSAVCGYLQLDAWCRRGFKVPF